MISEKVMTGFMAGNVTAFTLGSGPAPSIFAASYSWVSTEVKAAKYKIVFQPTSFHSWEPIRSGTKAFEEVRKFFRLSTKHADDPVHKTVS